MYSKVEDNQIGGAKAASITDEQALAVWDKLLAGLQFRVPVPGAPPGSYPTSPVLESVGMIAR